MIFANQNCNFFNPFLSGWRIVVTGNPYGVAPDSLPLKVKTKMQDKFMFFKNFAEAIRQSLPSEKQAEAYKAICEFALYDQKPTDPLLLTICILIAPSLFKTDGRKNNGGNHNPTGKNQHSNTDKEVNSGQSLVNVGQCWSIPLETETETINRNININSKPKTETETETGDKGESKGVENQDETNLEKPKSGKKKLDLSFLADSFLKETFERFLSYRKEIKKPYRSQMSVEQAFNELQKLSGGSLEKAEEIVNQSIANGWQGLFALKTENRTNQPKSMAELYAEATNW